MTDSLSWESWEEWDDLNQCFVLYVVGEINSRLSSQKLQLVKKDLPGLAASNLLLDVVVCPASTHKKYQELIYTEIVGQQEYECITVFFNHRVLTEITEIEKMDREASLNDDQWDEVV